MPTKKKLKQAKLKRAQALKEPSAKKRKLNDNEIHSPDESDDEPVSEFQPKSLAESESEEEEETAEAKKIRLVKEGLELDRLRVATEDTEADDIRDLIAERLREDRLEKEGRLFKEVANLYVVPSITDVKTFKCRWLKRTVTCVAVSPDKHFVYSGSKDCNIIKWCIKTGKRLEMALRNDGTEKTKSNHCKQILAMALSSDGKYLASGDAANRIHVWITDDLQLYHVFLGHRGPITGLVFRKTAHDLFSCSEDRSIKHWNIDNKSYVDTLFGHECGITDVDCLSQEQLVSSGGRDRTARRWQLIEAKQSIFRAPPGSLDCISFIDEGHFLTGSDQNSISVWSMRKKHPLVTVQKAHGENKTLWIATVRALYLSNVFASGSQDGNIRLWKCFDNFEKVSPLFSIPVVGCVNSLQFSMDGSMLVAALGQEMRLGRWTKLKNVKNTLCVVNLQKRNPDTDDNRAS